ncbi:hypothetical protein N0V82_008312 [Gnomoniopsis sp. IMI 355080]|nr:hypothetical protein N0V82_008312 [Gnomoniopsis sp. IMI 355080]
MGNEDEQFKQLQDKFAAEHSRRTRSLEAHMNKAKEFLEIDLAAGGIHHTPISARLKDQQKALRTLKRRNEARKELQDLRAMVEKRGPETWEQYCRLWNMEDKINETKPFPSVEEMFEAMHDLAGIRISLYFPDDVQRVVDLIGERFEIVDGPNRKGGLTRDFQKIRKLVEEQRQGQGAAEDGQGNTGNPEMNTSFPDSPFGGYRATHVVIRHRQDFDPHVRGDDTTNIEVQIGSIIMHAWSDIEHDILYKPSHTGKASPDVIRMLGLINGIVMTGEVALQQLASISAAESTRQVEDRTQKAMGPRYMTPWLDKYFMDRKQLLPSNRFWRSTGYLFAVLQATDEHSYGRLEELLDQMNAQPSNKLPVLVLHHLGRDTYPFQENRPVKMDSLIIPAWSARYWATCLVNTLNLATYMGTGNNMFDSMTKHTKKDESLRGEYPTFADFLDILHPTKVQRRHSHEDRIIKYCRAMLATTFGPQSYGLAAMKLASAGYVACPRISDKEEPLSGLNGPPMFIPKKLMRLDTLSALRIMPPSTIDKGLRSENEDLYFVPPVTEDGEDNCVWNAIRNSGKWDIIWAPFSYDTPVRFETDKETIHLLRSTS